MLSFKPNPGICGYGHGFVFVCVCVQCTRTASGEHLIIFYPFVSLHHMFCIIRCNKKKTQSQFCPQTKQKSRFQSGCSTLQGFPLCALQHTKKIWWNQKKWGGRARYTHENSHIHRICIHTHNLAVLCWNVSMCTHCCHQTSFLRAESKNLLVTLCVDWLQYVIVAEATVTKLSGVRLRFEHRIRMKVCLE